MQTRGQTTTVAKKNITSISINGRRYDPNSGQLLADNLVTPQKSAPPTLNDVMRVSKQTTALSGTIRPIAQPISYSDAANTKKFMDVQRSARGSAKPSGHVKAHQPQHTQTLMRTAVKKPVAGQRIKAISPTDVLANDPMTVMVAPKLSIQQIDESRLARAKHTAKSKLIRRFASPSAADIRPSAAVRVYALPPAALQNAQVSSSITENQSMDIFTRALAEADAHKETYLDPKKLARAERKQAKQARRTEHKPLRHRTATVVTASLAVLLLTGFVAYQNKTNIQLHLASAEAGFHASLPGYHPNGFAVSKLKYSTDTISTVFNNSDSNQAYTLTQKASNWDSQTLLDNVVANSNKTYQTIQNKGRTIYIYNNNDATWVDGGIVYQVSSQGNLSTSQLIDIATSL